jgi:hypothetical protein
VLGEAIEAGAAANQVEGVERQLKVDLSKIKFDVASKTARIKKGVLKPYSERDLELMSQVPPSTHGNILTIEYYLSIKTLYEGWSCLTY